MAFECSELEAKVKPSDESDQSFTKQELGVGNEETKLLGLQWNKAEHTITVTIPECEKTPTKRIVLRTMGPVRYPLGIFAPVTLVSKEIYCEICNRKLSLDEELPPDLKKRFRKWMNNLTKEISMTRSLLRKLEKIDAIDLHSFGDGSDNGISAVVHAVVHQEADVNQGFVAAKVQLAKKSLTIPRRELVAGH